MAMNAIMKFWSKDGNCRNGDRCNESDHSPDWAYKYKNLVLTILLYSKQRGLGQIGSRPAKRVWLLDL